MKIKERLDSWMSTVTGLGFAARDKTLSYLPTLDLPLDTGTVEALVTSDDLAYRIVTALPNKALKDGFTFSAASDDGEMGPQDAQSQVGEIHDACEAFDVGAKILEADAWGRAYGLGGILLGVDGAGLPDTPLNDDDPSAVLKSLTVVDRREILPESYYTDLADPKFGEVEFYRIQPSSYVGSIAQLIHETRIIRFGGALTSRRERMRNAGCDFSVLQRVFRVLQQANGNWSSLCALMSDMSQGVYKINGLMDMIASGNEAALQQRMTFMDLARSVTRSIVLDADKETFERIGTPMAGVNDVLEQTWKRVAAAAEMPLTVLMGMSPAGLNATGESDMRLWYDTVRAHQEHVLAPRILRIAKLLSRAIGHANADAWRVTFPSLWQMTASEQAVYRFQVAQADAVYIDKGVLLAEEVALSRFASGSDFDGATTMIDVDARKAALDTALAEMKDPTPPPMPHSPGQVPAAAVPPPPPAVPSTKADAEPADTRADELIKVTQALVNARMAGVDNVDSDALLAAHSIPTKEQE